MTAETIFALALAALIFAATPGPAIMAGVARALSSGFAAAVALNVGIILGDIIFLLLAVYGLSAIAELLGSVFFVVKIAGGAYLVWLGWKMWRRASTPIEVRADAGEPDFWRGVGGGFLIAISNPKAILFYAGFLPAFMDLSTLSIGDVGITTAVITTVIMAVNCTYAWSATRARKVFASRQATRKIHRTAGVVMAGTGLVIATR